MTAPKAPKVGAWKHKGAHPAPPGLDGRAEVYDHVSGMRVISGVDAVDEAGTVRLEFHLSISCAGRRANWEQVRQALRDFEMVGAQEDNHIPGGVARNFWLPVGMTEAPECPCVETEKPHDEGDGYVWREVPER